MWLSDTPARKASRQARAPECHATTMVFSPDGTKLAVEGSRWGTQQRWARLRESFLMFFGVSMTQGMNPLAALATGHLVKLACGR